MRRELQGRASEAAWVTFALLAAAAAWDAGGLDLPLARLAGGAAGFPWRDHWLLSMVLHKGGRRLALLLAVLLCLAVWWPVGPLVRVGRSERLQLAVSSLLAALVVSLLKSGSSTSCPWELTEFGGLARYASHWSLQPDGGQGHCFPGGHAASGFAFAAGYFALRRTEPILARRWLLAALAGGLTLGLAQQWRGAHFMSHTLWSAAACWTAGWLVDATWPRALCAAGGLEGG